MRIAVRSLLLILIAALAHQEIHVERATEDEARQVKAVSDAFEQRMRETRDAGSLKDLFLNDFVRLHIEEERGSSPDKSHVSFSSIPVSIDSSVITEVTHQELERFYTADLNLRYYFVLLLVSRMRVSDIESGKKDFRQDLFPSDVLKLLQADPFLRQYGPEDTQTETTLKTGEQLRSLITTLEQATLKLRQDFLKHPPERTRIYQENLRLATNPERPGDRWINPDVYGTGESKLRFPKGTRFFHRMTADSFFELWLVKTDEGMRIVWARVYPFN